MMTAREAKFRKILEDHQDLVWNLCRHFTKSEEDTRDLQQEVMISVWRHLDSFRGESALSTWIYRIATNASLTYVMKENRRLGFNLRLDARQAELLAIQEDTSEALRKEAQLQALQDVIDRLNVIDKLLITLSIERVSTKEMAEIIGITEPNVRTKLHRIREEMREKMKGDRHE